MAMKRAIFAFGISHLIAAAGGVLYGASIQIRNLD
jgi:hypothetical protein